MSIYIDAQKNTIQKIGSLYLDGESKLPNHQFSRFNPKDGDGFSELYDFGKLCVGKGKYWLEHSNPMTAEAPIQAFGITILLSGTHHFINHQSQQSYTLQSPAIILRRGNIGKQTIYLQQQSNMALVTLDFDHNLLHSLDSITQDNAIAYFFLESSASEIKTLQLQHNDAFLHQSHYLLNLPLARSSIDLLHLEGAALELLSAILHHKRSNTALPLAIRKTIEILDHDFHQKLTIRALARQAGINECDLKKLFKLHMQQTIGTYLLNTRMQNAQLMLKEGHPVQHAAHASGYDNPQYFKKIFKQYFGYSL
jgi:AraC-like DNA-binding protein